MAPRPRDEIWDALDLHFGPVRTESERGRRNRSVLELRAAGATPEEIAVAFNWCRRSFTTFSEMALVTNFGRAQHDHISEQSRPNLYDAVKRMAQGDG